MRLTEIAGLHAPLTPFLDQIAFGIILVHGIGCALGAGVTFTDKNGAVRCNQHIVRGIAAFTVAAATLHADRHQMHAGWAELVDLMAIRFAVISFDLVGAAGIGNPDISVMIDLNAVWPGDIAGAKAANHISIFIEQHHHVGVRAVDAGVDVAAAALGNPDALAIRMNIHCA